MTGRSTIISLCIALLLAALAVLAAHSWLSAERQAIRVTAAKTPQTQGDPSHTIVVASHRLEPGSKLTADNLKEIAWHGKTLPTGVFEKIEALASKDAASSRYALSVTEENEPVFSGKITLPGQRAKLSAVLSENMKAVSIRVNDVLGVAGFVLPGDRVDVLLTRKSGTGKDSDAWVDVLLQNIRVLAIDQLADDQAEEPSVVRTVTIEVPTIAAQKLTLAASAGTLSLALRNIGASNEENLVRVSLADLDSLGTNLPPLSDRSRDTFKERSTHLNISPKPTASPRPTEQTAKTPLVSSTAEPIIVVVSRNGRVQEYQLPENRTN